MQQINLNIQDAVKERRWFPENHINGEQFAIRLNNKLWYIATLVNEKWIVDGKEISKDTISHYANLD